jgi:hypothetical protein
VSEWLPGRPLSLAGQLPQGLGTSVKIWSAVSRHRWQASSYSGSGAFVSEWLPGRPLSLAGQLPQGLGTSVKIWSAVSRHRWQASSYSGSGAFVSEWLPGRPLSLAGQLPQGLVVLPYILIDTSPVWELASQLVQRKAKRRIPSAFHHSSGRALARLQLLILRCTPHREAEWRFCAVGTAARMPR